MIVDGYVRVSDVRGRVGEAFISPSVQREQIERWARVHRATLSTVFEELDQSGATTDRPMLTEMLGRVEDGQTDGVVVASLDRFGRSLIDNLAAIQRIHDAGAAFVSLREGLDLSTDTGKLVLRIMLSMAEWELDRVRTRWNTARQRATERGVHMGLYPPTGYRRDHDGRLQPHEHAGPFITELYRRRARGESIRDLCTFLEQAQVPTSRDSRIWEPAALHKLLRNRVYLGELHHGEMSNPHAHPPLTDAVTWNAAQKPRDMTSHPDRRLPTLLDGILRCAGCRMLMRSQTVTTPGGLRKRIYYCGRRFKAGECPNPAWISAAVAEPYLDAVFFTLARDRKDSRSNPARLRRLQLDHEHATDELLAYGDSPAIRAALDAERYAEGLAERHERERHAALAIAAEHSKGTSTVPPLHELEQSWPNLGVPERRRLMAELIDCAFASKRGEEHPRIFACARGDAPVDLPQRGNRRDALHPFHPYSGRRAEPVTRPTWTDQQITTVLASFLVEWHETRWPTDEELVFAGYGPLMREINQTGGPTRWGATGSLRPKRRATWTDARIRATLDEILPGRTWWPTRSDFTALGLEGLYSVLDRRGRREWAEEYGLRYRNTGGAAKRWTAPRVYEELESLCAGRAAYPSADEFTRAGLAGLYGAILRRHGGHDRWASIMALPRRGGRN